MKTKLVYVVVCNDRDIYFEQAFVSAWSARYHNPDLPITVVIDPVSRKCISDSAYANFRSLINEEIIYKPDNPCPTNMEKSRWLKTALRNIIEGDFLYVDSDTVITDSLQSLDALNCSVGFVPDWNCSLDQNISRYYYSKEMKRMFHQEMRIEGNYFNGGVFYAKDDEKSHEFLNAWHKNWKYCQNNGYYRDQLSLLKTTQDFSNLVVEIDGAYNCQLAASLQYLPSAKILHFYSLGHTFALFPFFKKEIYKRVKQDGNISHDLIENIINVKARMGGPSISLGNEHIEIVQGAAYRLLHHVFVRHSKLYNRLNKISKLFLKIS